MSNFIQKIGWKKIFVAVSLLIIIIIATVHFIQSKKAAQPEPAQQTQPTDTTNQSQVPSNNSAPQEHIVDRQPPPSVAPLMSWKTFKGGYFDIQYPPDWKYISAKNPDGSFIATFIPVSLPANTDTPLLSVSATPISPTDTDFEAKLQTYLYMGFKREVITFADLQATKLSGAFPVKTVKGTPVKSPVHLTHLYTNTEKYNYLIAYRYDGSNADPTYEKLFSSILATLHIFE